MQFEPNLAPDEGLEAVNVKSIAFDISSPSRIDSAFHSLSRWYVRRDERAKTRRSEREGYSFDVDIVWKRRYYEWMWMDARTRGSSRVGLGRVADLGLVSKRGSSRRGRGRWGDDGPTLGNGENVETKGLTWNPCVGLGGCGVGARETGDDDGDGRGTWFRVRARAGAGFDAARSGTDASWRRIRGSYAFDA